MLTVKTISPARLTTNAPGTLPIEIGELVAKNLPPHELIALSQVNSHYSKLCNHNQLWSRFLKPQAQIGLNMTGSHTAKELYKDPRNRLKDWLTEDMRGQNYLYDLMVVEINSP